MLDRAVITENTRPSFAAALVLTLIGMMLAQAGASEPQRTLSWRDSFGSALPEPAPIQFASAQADTRPMPSFAVRGAATCQGNPSGPVPNPGFGNGTPVVLDLDGGDYPPSNAVAVQPDGLVLAGGSKRMQFQNGRDAVLARLLPDGQPDPDFGDGGQVLLNVVPAQGDAEIVSIALEPDGRIIVLGRLIPNLTESVINWFFARLTSNGAFDTTFDFNGIRIVNLGGAEIPYKLIRQPDGKLLGVGQAYPDLNKPLDTCALLMRLNADGSNDSSFGDGGSVCLFSGNEERFAVGTDLVRQADGTILVTGFATHGAATPADNIDMAVFRLLANGSLDTGFGEQGWAFVAFDQGGQFADGAFALALDSAGRITLAGLAEGVQFNDMAMARLLPDGSLDGSFGVNGRALIPFGSDEGSDDRGFGLAALPAGRLLLIGSTRAPFGFTKGAAVVLHADGSLDACFADNGRWVQEPPSPAARGTFLGVALGGDAAYLVGVADDNLTVTGLSVTGRLFQDRFEDQP